MSVIEEIKDRLDVVDVISTYVQLQKAGRNYKGLCPFHNEKTPSFVVFPETQGWHCFGACSTGGDIFTFVMKRENLDFGEALALLAAKAGVELKERNASEDADASRLERLRAILTDTVGYYHTLLMRHSEAAIARDYLERRGLTRETWEAWQLGYSLDSWDALKDRLLGKGYRPEEVEEAGLLIQREEGIGYYDRFRGRFMIPIRDVQGRPIGFGARILREDPAHPAPKYMNSPQTPLFDKSNVLFGLDMARKAIRDADLAVLVEGYMDVIGSHQVGVTNVVAGMGTALTEAQMRQLKRYSSNITLALDPDAAGEHATIRGLEAARQSLAREWQPVISPSGLVRQESRLKAQLHIAALPDGLDPDELALQDVTRWQKVIAEARPVVDYYLNVVAREEDLSSAHGKAAAVTRVAPLIREIASPVERAHYLQMLARMVQTDERLIADQVMQAGRLDDRRGGPEETAVRGRTADRGRTAGRAAAPELVQRPAVSASRYGLEEYLLGWLYLRPDLLAALDADMITHQAPPLNPDDFSREDNRALLIELQALPVDALNQTAEDRLAELPQVLEERGRYLVAQVQHRPSLTDEKLLKDLGDALLRLRERNLVEQVQQMRFLILENQESGSADEARTLRELMTTYTAQKGHIHKLLSTRSMAGLLAQRKPTTAGEN
jgi:DNA primase